MKIKHWQGYGSVEAKVIKKTSTIDCKGTDDHYEEFINIQVKGNHEYGIETYDKHFIAQWLGCPKLGNFEAKDIISVVVVLDEIFENGEWVEIAIYKLMIDRVKK